MEQDSTHNPEPAERPGHTEPQSVGSGGPAEKHKASSAASGMTSPNEANTEGGEVHPAEEGSAGTATRWIEQNLPVGWQPASYADIPVHLPDIQLLALYLHTRKQAGSLAAKLAGIALMTRFDNEVKQHVHRYVSQRPGVQQRDMRAYYNEGWLGFLVALGRYNPFHAQERSETATSVETGSANPESGEVSKAGRAGKGKRDRNSNETDKGAQAFVPIMSYAAWEIKNHVIRQVIDDLPKDPATTNTRKAYLEALETYNALAQKEGREPSEEEVADALAPRLPAGWGSIETRRRVVRDLFRVLKDDTATIAMEQPDEEEGPSGEVQIASHWGMPEAQAIESENIELLRDILAYTWSRAEKNLGNATEVRKLLVVQVLLNIRNPEARARRKTGPRNGTNLGVDSETVTEVEREGWIGTDAADGSSYTTAASVNPDASADQGRDAGAAEFQVGAGEDEDPEEERGYYNLRKIAKFIRGATPRQLKQQREVEEWWDLLWHNLDLDRFGLEPSWDKTRALFLAPRTRPPLDTEGALRNWYAGALMRADWKWTDH